LLLAFGGTLALVAMTRGASPYTSASDMARFNAHPAEPSLPGLIGRDRLCGRHYEATQDPVPTRGDDTLSVWREGDRARNVPAPETIKVPALNLRKIREGPDSDGRRAIGIGRGESHSI